MLELNGRGAIIVGARRVGQTVVERLAREGVSPAIVYRRSRDEAESLQRQVVPLVDRSCVVQADLTVEDDVKRAIATAKQELGDLSFAINLASDYPYAPFDQLDAQAWERGMSAARGAYLFALHAARAMKQNQGPTRGHIVMFGDWAAAETPYTGYLPYLTAKASIHFMTRAFALELAGSGILVNAISPGPTAKPPDMTDAAWQAVVNRAPLRRESSDEEMAELICTLLRLETVTGQNIRVDSGKSLSGTAGG
jgi:pteridine reductase